MRAVEILEPGGADVLRQVVKSIPQPNRNEVLIKISYAGVNRPDVLQRAGSYLPPPGASELPGLEASGTIIDIGDNVTDWNMGDEVCALLPGGLCRIRCNTSKSLFARSKRYEFKTSSCAS